MWYPTRKDILRVMGRPVASCAGGAAIGYLVIFNTSNKQIRWAVSGSADPVPRVVVNHKTIFFLVVDLYLHETTASKRPQQEIVEITEDEILGAVKVS